MPRTLSGLILIVLVSACGSGAPSTGAASAPPTADDPVPESTAPIASEADAPESATAGGCTPPELCGDALAPGEYAATVRSTPVTFSVDDGWRGTAYGDTGFDMLVIGDGPPQIVSAAPYDGVVYSDVCSGAETEEIGATSADFIGFLTGRSGITARGEATEVSVGGRSGLQVDVDVADPGCVSDPPERLWLWEIAGVTDFHLNIGEAARVIALDGEDGVIVLVVETFDPATFESLLERTQPVLDSMTIG